mgnify:CR=1 FL=1
MALRIKEYRVRNGRTRLDEDYFNKVFGDIDTRIHAQEVVEKDWKSAIRTVTSAGLQRINDLIGPAITEIQQLTTLGFLHVRAAQSVEVVWQLGEQPIALALDTDADRTRAKHFHPSPFLVITDDADPATYLIARTIGMEVMRGDAEVIVGAVLNVDVVSIVGSPPGGSVVAPWCVSSPAATALLVDTTENAVVARDEARAASDLAVAAQDGVKASETAAAASEANAQASEANAAASEAAAAQHAENASLSPVDSVFGRTGHVIGNPSDVGLTNVTNDAQAKRASNLSDLNNASAARGNLGLGSASTKNVGTGASDIPQNSDLGTQATKDQHIAGSSQNTNDGDVTYVV